MLYAKVVLGIAVEGPFDYIVPPDLERKISVGSRVWVTLRTQRMVGYVVGLAHKTNISHLKNILSVIDECPVLDKNMLSLAKELSDYYCCSWGEAIETALPASLRKGRVIPAIKYTDRKSDYYDRKIVLLHDLDGRERWDIYLTNIEETLRQDKSVIFILPDIESARRTQRFIHEKLHISLAMLYRKQPSEWKEWVKIREGKVGVVIGTRSAVFAPFNNLGLIIIDEEEDSVYKQEQVPHYHAREIASMRAGTEKAKLILASASVSLESFYQAKKNEISYTFIPRKKEYPEIKIIDMKYEKSRIKSKNIILSKYLQDSIASTLASGGKALLFLNRKGFATFASCSTCGTALRCPRCNINLVYHFKDNMLECHYCNFKMPPPQICPSCNSGYIKYSGIGTEKIEGELSRVFPCAKIKRQDNQESISLKDTDICISTSAIMKHPGYNFDLTGVLFIDNSLNRIDLRASEKTFGLLTGLLALTEKKFIIQTSLPGHHSFKALIEKDVALFYKEELKQRKQLNFPPYTHMILVKLRGRDEDKVKTASLALFEKLNKSCSGDIDILAVNPGQPAKLRGNFYWQILISSHNPKKAAKFLKIHLKDFSHSGIIVTVDVDPL